MKKASAFFNKAAVTFLIAGLAALAINFIGSLFFHDELKLNWPIILIIALLAALISYLSALRNHVAELEERIDALESKLKRK